MLRRSITAQILTRGMVTLVTDGAWAQHFTQAGLPAVVEADMHSWLRTHAVMVVPVMTVANIAYARQGGASWREARQAANAWVEGFALVRRLGTVITPTAMTPLAWLPSGVMAALLWTLSRVPAIRKSGAAGPNEPRALIDVMRAAAPSPTPALLAIRPTD